MSLGDAFLVGLIMVLLCALCCSKCWVGYSPDPIGMLNKIKKPKKG